jgi:hypothetical protein
VLVVWHGAASITIGRAGGAVTRTVGTIYLVLSLAVGALLLVVALFGWNAEAFILAVAVVLSGLVLPAILFGLADIADELRALRAEGAQYRSGSTSTYRGPSSGSTTTRRDSRPASAGEIFTPLREDDETHCPHCGKTVRGLFPGQVCYHCGKRVSGPSTGLGPG